MKKKIKIGGIFITFICVLLLMVVGFVRSLKDNAKDVYLVYLDGEKIGLIENKNELYNLIDKEQEHIKTEYGVDRVYPPSGLEATKYTTYSNDLKSANEIYDEIEKKSTFTILGYTVTIKGEETEAKYINILNKEDLEPALMDAVSAFIDRESLELYINDNQVEIKDTGKKIENVYFDETITIKEKYLSADDNIITNKSDLTKYLLFGTLEKQEEYTVKRGDTIKAVAFNNKLSTEELLIANPDLGSVNTLLSPGQVLNIGLISPLFTIIEESEVIEDVPELYKTVEEEDNTKYASQSYVKREGTDGLARVTEKVQYRNGEIVTLLTKSSETLVAPVDKVVVIGTLISNDYDTRYYPPAVSETNWGWPTTNPWVITSEFGWRWGSLHKGIDISGPGFGSPIYASTDGTVYDVITYCDDIGYYGSLCGYGYGNHVEIKMDNGIQVVYGHMKSNVQVNIGTYVKKGQLLGYMGSSGSSTGTHLHFEIRDIDGVAYDPCGGAFRC